MRLLNTSTYQIVSVKHPSETHYAALSHVWGDSEQTFQVRVDLPALICHEFQLTNPCTGRPKHPHRRAKQLSERPRR